MKENEFDTLREHALVCTNCQLCETRKHVVFGVGSKYASVMFVGEAPGKDEDEQGVPFVGRAGQILNQLFDKFGIKRDYVYITNTVKCRPIADNGRGNRPPNIIEIGTCKQILEQELKHVNPLIICPMGGVATAALEDMFNFLPYGFRSMNIHAGKQYKDEDGKIFIPLYHPAFAIYSGSTRALEKGFEALVEVVNSIGV